MTTNIFVHHHADREGRLLADMIRVCDSDGRFRFLPLESRGSFVHMEDFLARQGLAPAAVGLPFVVVCHGSPEDPACKRSVLYGERMQEWLEGLAEAFLELGPPDALVREHLTRATVRLIAGGPPADPAPAPAAAAPPPPAAAEEGEEEMPAPPSGDPSPEIEEEVPTEEVVMMASADMPRRAGGGKVVNITDVMQQSKQRDTMSASARLRR